MANPFDVLSKYFRKPTVVPATAVTNKVHLDDKEKEILKRLGVYVNDLTNLVNQNTMVNWERNNLYKEIERALVHPLIGASVELYADYATNYDRINNGSVWITSESEPYKNKLEDLLESIGIEEKIFDWAYQLTAFGDLFVKINAIPGVGVVSIDDSDHPLSISRVDKDGVLIGFYKTPYGISANEGRQLMPPWEYVHLRVLGAKKKRPLWNDPSFSEYKSVSLLSPDVRRLTSKYGTSLILNAIPIYKRMRLAEDSLLLARLSKGVMRYIFKVGVDSSNIEAVSEIMEDYKVLLKRTRAVDTSNTSPGFQENFDMMDVLTDLVIPVWGDVNNLTVEKLGGEPDIRWIVDIEEMRNQLASALRVPLQLLGGYSGEMPSGLGRSAIERLDIRFARSARRLQRSLIEGIKRICQIHLAYQGMSADLSMFDVNMADTSTAEEEEIKDALDKGVDITEKMFDLMEKAVGSDLNKIELLDYLNQKILKLNDIELHKLLKSDSEMAKTLESRLNERKGKIEKTRKKVWKQNTDLSSFTPIKESSAKWTEVYGACKVTEEEIANNGK